MMNLITTSEHQPKLSTDKKVDISEIKFKGKQDYNCVEITGCDEGTKYLKTGYYIGTDWLSREHETAVYVEPKLNNESQQTQTDYLQMLFSCMRHSDIANYTSDLYEIKFDEPYIELPRSADLLTPILIVQFLQVLKIIVRKGLKKSYYEEEQNLNSKIKGKVDVAKTVKHNMVKNKATRTYCRYQSFGVNCVENRILKSALMLVQKYISLYPSFSEYAVPVINYCSPAFHNVNETVDIATLKSPTYNVFYKEYKEALRIAKLIFKRAGYNIKNKAISKNETISLPPFWVDMSKLFELYVLGLLKDKYHNNIKFQVQGTYGQPDFVLVTEKVIIDTKYKPQYEIKYVIEDIRQLSGYARDKKVLKKLGIENEVASCLIIYPNQQSSEKLDENLFSKEIDGFLKFYKLPIKLPEITPVSSPHE